MVSHCVLSFIHQISNEADYFSICLFLFKKYILLIMLLQLSQFFLPFISLVPVLPTFQHSTPPLSSCPWVAQTSSLTSPFPVLFLTYPCPLFCAYLLCFLFPVPFPLSSPFLFPAENPPNDLHIYDSIPVLLVCLVCFLDSVVDRCEFVAILMFIVLIFFFIYNTL